MGTERKRESDDGQHEIEVAIRGDMSAFGVFGASVLGEAEQLRNEDGNAILVVCS